MRQTVLEKENRTEMGNHLKAQCLNFLIHKKCRARDFYAPFQF